MLASGITLVLKYSKRNRPFNFQYNRPITTERKQVGPGSNVGPGGAPEPEHLPAALRGKGRLVRTMEWSDDARRESAARSAYFRRRRGGPRRRPSGGGAPAQPLAGIGQRACGKGRFGDRVAVAPWVRGPSPARERLEGRTPGRPSQIDDPRVPGGSGDWKRGGSGGPLCSPPNTGLHARIAAARSAALGVGGPVLGKFLVTGCCSDVTHV